MSTVKTNQQVKPSKRRDPPAMTPEARENQMIALAVNLAEEQLRNGTASAQVITHYLKMGSERERRELEILRSQNALLEAKVKQIESQEKTEELYRDALSAMKQYRGDRDE